MSTISSSVSDGNGGTDTATVSITVTPVNDAPVLVLSTNTMGGQYSDAGAPVVLFTATDVDNPPSDLTFSATGLINDLAITTDPAVGGVGAPRTGSISGRLNAAAGTHIASITVNDGSGGTDTEQLTVNVTRENADVIEFSPAAIQTDGADNDLDTLTVTMTVKEPFDGFYSKTLNSGIGLANAKPITVTLTPVGAGSSYTCTATNTQYDPSVSLDTAKASCTIPNVAPDVYDTVAVIGGNYFTGGGQGVITVYNPALGFTTGGGWYTADNGDRVNFGFNVKYLKNGKHPGFADVGRPPRRQDLHAQE